MKKITITLIVLILFAIPITVTMGSKHLKELDSTEASVTIEAATTQATEATTEITTEISDTEVTQDYSEEVNVAVDTFNEEDTIDNEAITYTSVNEIPDNCQLELSIIDQYPELPAGCESVSLTMLLNYYGYDLDKTYIVDNYLVYDDNFVLGYYGDPYSYSVGGGCYAPGMTITANNFLQAEGSSYYANNITGTSLDDLLVYVANGTPVMVWSTISMISPNKGYYQYDEYGNAYGWDYNEHCVVLAGYDISAGTLTIYDPIEGIVERDKESFEYTYDSMYQMAIVLE